MCNRKHNNHMVQRAFVKDFFGGAETVDFIRIESKESGTLEIDSYESPLVITDFHTDEIETGMNILENQGVQIVRKINKQIDEGKVTINRKESMTLRFYLMLGIMRSQTSRGDIDKLRGDSLFNKAVGKAKGTPQEIHEEKIGELLRIFELFRNDKDYASVLSEFSNNAFKSGNPTKYFEDNMTVKNSVHMSMLEVISSRLMFFEIGGNGLMFQEKPAFQEISRANSPRSIYNFFPISVHHGIMLVNKSPVERECGSVQEQSKVFEADLNSMHSMKYERENEMISALMKYLKDNNLELTRENQTKWGMMHNHSFYTNRDSYTFDVFKEDADVADFCNAMMSVHNRGGIVMYTNKDQISGMFLKKDQYGIYDIATGK